MEMMRCDTRLPTPEIEQEDGSEDEDEKEQEESPVRSETEKRNDRPKKVNQEDMVEAAFAPPDKIHTAVLLFNRCSYNQVQLPLQLEDDDAPDFPRAVAAGAGARAPCAAVPAPPSPSPPRYCRCCL
ncbi:hypothetical protein AAHA92_20031 [Salvia divinorum]|uniref:Uncharacterized protein n=1 Tax=Salvia divinorum TaxID=28513 RepID=A0ABD1GIJ8_SALDI